MKPIQPMESNAIPLAPEHCVKGFGVSLIVAPHADDESLGCGGVTALLSKYDQPVYILLLSDGTLSHPHSKKFPSEKLRDLRETELVNAAAILGVAADHLIFCRFTDRHVPSLGNPNFMDAVQNINKILSIIQPQSIFVPWRRDPHPDHRAAYQLLKHAQSTGGKLYEYAIWLDQTGNSEDAPLPHEVLPFRLDISSVLSVKQLAIAQHRSQITDFIDDDPQGFRISAEMLESFNVPYETFYISK